MLQINGVIDILQFGAKNDGVTDCAGTITALNAYVGERFNNIDSTEPSEVGRNISATTVNITGKFAFSNELILWGGTEYILNNGSILFGLSTGQTMVRTPLASEIYAASTTPYYSSTQVSITGNGWIDGQDLASVGLLLDTVAAHSKIEVRVRRVAHRRWTTTGDSDGTTTTFASTTNVKILDTLEVVVNDNDSRFHTVISINGSAVTTVPAIPAGTGLVLEHRAVAISGHMLQQSMVSCEARLSDVGLVLSANAIGVGSTDMKIIGGTYYSNNYCVININTGGGNRFIGTTIQHAIYQELINLSPSVFSGCYLESGDDTAAAQDIPFAGANGGVPIGLTRWLRLPICVNKSTATFNDIEWPGNFDRTGHKILIDNYGTCVVNGARSNTGPIQENPDRAGDYSVFRQSSTEGYLTVNEMTGPTNGTLDRILDENGDVPDSNRGLWKTTVGGRERVYANDTTYYSNSTNTFAAIMKFNVSGGDDSHAPVRVYKDRIGLHSASDLDYLDRVKLSSTGLEMSLDGTTSVRKLQYDSGFNLQKFNNNLLVNGTGLFSYAGNPEGFVTANRGAICMDTATGDMYRKTGFGTSGWVTP